MIDIQQINFDKLNGLIPVCIQDNDSMQVLMIGFMNQEALAKTLSTKIVTFWSRSRHCLWTKGETSGHYLHMKDCYLDCDNDSLLINAVPCGPTCHTGEMSCFGNSESMPLYALSKLIKIIDDRYNNPKQDSYTTLLFNDGVSRMAQKVGEEGVEVALAGVTDNTKALANESADLLFHLLVLLRAKGVDLADVTDVIRDRMKPK